MENFTPNDWSVEIVTKGPHGSVIYREHSHTASFYWEYGGGEVIAIVHCGLASAWSEKYPWANDRRDEVLGRVMKEVLRQKCAGCIAKMDEESGNMHLYRGDQFAA